MVRTNAKVSIDAGVSCSTRQVLVAAERNMLVCSSITVTFCQTKVNQINHITLAAKAHQKIVRFYITVDEILGVNILDAANLYTPHICMYKLFM